MKLRLNNTTLFEKDYQPSVSYNDGTFSGTLTAALAPTLNPETLEDPDGGISLSLKLSGTALLAHQVLYDNYQFFPTMLLLSAEEKVFADLKFNLVSQAQVEFIPGSGFTLVGGGASNLNLGLTSSLTGEVDFGWITPPFLTPILKVLHAYYPSFFPSASSSRLWSGRTRWSDP